MSIASSARLLALAALCAAPVFGLASVFTPGEFRVNEMGAATYSIPIQVPPGLNGIQPKLGLSYNNQSGNGLVGQGWAISGLSTITRCPKTRAQDGEPGGVQYNMDDRFCLDGQKLMLISGAYGAANTEYRTELESFSKIVANGSRGNGPASFTVWQKDGRIMEYGQLDSSTDAQILAEGKDTVATWALKRVRDRKGNVLVVSYESAKAGEYHPLRMDYAYNLVAANNSPKAAVVFSYEDRPDPKTSYRGGSTNYLQKRLTQIATYSAGSLVRTYQLTYDPNAAFWSNVLPLSRLTQIKECGANGQCQVPVNLVWNPSGWGHVDLGYSYRSLTPYSITPVFYDQNGTGKEKYTSIDWGDSGIVGVGRFDGSGGQDVVYSGCYGRCFEFVRDDQYSHAQLGMHESKYSSFSVKDLNLDGLDDILQIVGFSNGLSGEHVGFTISYINKGDYVFESKALDHGLVCAGTDAGDVDGDGVTDLVVVGDLHWTAANYPYMRYPLEFRLYKGLSVGGFSSVPYTTFQIPMNGYDLWDEDTGCNGSNVKMRYVDQDSVVDGLRISLPDGRAIEYSNKGDGKFFQSAENGLEVSNQRDFNGDGYVDYMECIEDGDDGCVKAGLVVRDGFNEKKTIDVDQYVKGMFSIYWHIPMWDVVMGDATGTGELTYVLADGRAGRFTHNQPLITSIKAGDTPIVSLSYAPVTQYANAFSGAYNNYKFGGAQEFFSDSSAPSYPNAFLPYTHLRVVDQVTHLGHGAFKYEYQGLLSNHKGRGMLGFASVKATNTNTGVNTTTLYNQLWPFTGTAWQTIQRNGAGQLLTQVSNGYHAIPMGLNNKVTYASLYATVDGRYEPGNSAPYNVVTTKRVSDCHNFAAYELGEMGTYLTGLDSSGQCYGNILAENVSATDGYSKLTQTSFRNNNAQWLVGLPVTMKVTDTAPDTSLALGGASGSSAAGNLVSSGASQGAATGSVAQGASINRGAVPTYSNVQTVAPTATLKSGRSAPVKPD